MRIRSRLIIWSLAAVFFANVLAGLLAQPLAATDEPEGTPFTATLLIGGSSVPLAGRATSSGPLFALPQLAEALGGTLSVGAYGEGFTLKIADSTLLFGPGSPVLTAGDELVRLSQPPMASPAGVLAPLDLLERAYGGVAGYRFDWDRGTLTLRVSRSSLRAIEVGTELVHLQGTTTLAFQFSEIPRYAVEQAAGLVTIEVRGGRLVAVGPPPAADPMVRRVSVGEQRIEIHLAAGAATQRYVLKEPFRLVFDVFPELAAAGGTTAVRVLPPRRMPGLETVVLDPGHGGAESGAVGPTGATEKELTLLLAQALRGELARQLGLSVVLTREEDADLPLITRTAIANQNKADLFISLHLNSSYGRQAHGAETFILATESTDAGAADTAFLENRSDGDEAAPRSGAGDPLYDLELILWDMSQSHHLGESLRFATLVQEELNRTLQLRDRGVKQAPFRVLTGAAMPAVLVELGFLSNPEEEKKLLDPAYRAELVGALTRAVGRYRAAVDPTAAPLPAAESAHPEAAP